MFSDFNENKTKSEIKIVSLKFWDLKYQSFMVVTQSASDYWKVILCRGHFKTLFKTLEQKILERKMLVKQKLYLWAVGGNCKRKMYPSNED